MGMLMAIKEQCIYIGIRIVRVHVHVYHMADCACAFSCVGLGGREGTRR